MRSRIGQVAVPTLESDEAVMLSAPEEFFPSIKTSACGMRGPVQPGLGTIVPGCAHQRTRSHGFRTYTGGRGPELNARAPRTAGLRFGCNGRCAWDRDGRGSPE